MAPNRTLSVVVPVYNEAATLDAALDRILARPEVDQLVLVDDGSEDGSREILARREDPPRLVEGLQAIRGLLAEGLRAVGVDLGVAGSLGAQGLDHVAQLRLKGDTGFTHVRLVDLGDAE